MAKVSDSRLSSADFGRSDLLILGLILLMGVFTFLFYQRSSDFLGEDVFYADCARSLLQHGVYGLPGRPETTQPPGLSAVLAVLFVVFGYSRAICLHAMAVFEALGFGFAYALLRRRLALPVSAGMCLVLMSSGVFFGYATQIVFPAYPLFFATMATLWSFERCERAAAARYRLVWGLSLTLLVVASILIASSAIALPGAILAVIAVTFLKDRQLGMVRLRRYAPVILVGISVQWIWMHRQPAPREWNLPGYPAPYFEQLKVKSGNDPELGLADVWDIPVRISTNILSESDLFAEAILRHGLNQSKLWVVTVPVLLTAAGWAYSVWPADGGLLEWYFAGYQLIYLLWPWKFELRFFIPIAPLACLYLWRGIQAIDLFAAGRPRFFGLVSMPIGIVLGISGLRDSGPGRFPDVLIAPLWILFSLAAAQMIYTGRPLSLPTLWAKRIRRLSPATGLDPSRLVYHAAWMTTGVLIFVGLTVQAGIARDNIRIPDRAAATDVSVNPMAREIESGRWIRSHTPSDAVVMARHLPIVYHYASRRMVWFAPISNPDVLMNGIVSHGVDYIVVVKHKSPYYLPDDDVCFEPILTKYGNAFRMVFNDSDLRIFRVARTGGDKLTLRKPPVTRDMFIRDSHTVGTSSTPGIPGQRGQNHVES